MTGNQKGVTLTQLMVAQDKDLLGRLGDLLVWSLAFVPLLVDPLADQPYVTGKLAAFRLLVLGAVTLWLIGAWRRGSCRIAVSRLHFPLIAFVGAAAVSAALSVSGPTAVFGYWMRYEGLLSYLFYALAFSIAYQFAGERERAERLLGLTLLGATIASMVGIFQVFGLSLLPEPDPNRIGSLMGNPGFFAGYLALLLPVAVAMFLNSSDFSSSRSLAGLAAGCSLVALALTYTRSAWIGAAIGVAVALSLSTVPWRRRAAAIGSLAVVTVVLVIALTGGSVVRTGAGRLSGTLTGINSPRLLYWSVATRAIAERPVFGWGPDTFAVVYQMLRPPDWLRRGEVAIVDKAHNEFLQLGATVGLLGLAAFVWLVARFLRRGFRFMRQGSGDGYRRTLVAGLLGGVLAYLTFLQAFFSVTELAIVFWIWLGVGCRLVDGEPYRELSFRLPAAGRPAVIGLALAAAVAAVLSLAPEVAGVQYAQMRARLGEGASRALIRDMKRVARLDPTEEHYRLMLGIMLTEAGARDGDRSMFNDGVGTLTDVVHHNSASAAGYVALGDAYMRAEPLIGQGYARKAAAFYRRAGQVSRYSPLILQKRAAADMAGKRWRSAAAGLEASIALYPDPDSYQKLAVAYKELGRRPAARRALMKSRALADK